MTTPPADDRPCRSCGRPFRPTHDVDSPGPTSRHPFFPVPLGRTPAGYDPDGTPYYPPTVGQLGLCGPPSDDTSVGPDASRRNRPADGGSALALVLASLAVDPSKHSNRERVLYAEVQRLGEELDSLRIWAAGAAHYDCLDRASRLEARLADARALHAELRVDDEGYRGCVHCGGDYPCDTLQALDGPSQLQVVANLGVGAPEPAADPQPVNTDLLDRMREGITSHEPDEAPAPMVENTTMCGWSDDGRHRWGLGRDKNECADCDAPKWIAGPAEAAETELRDVYVQVLHPFPEVVTTRELADGVNVDYADPEGDVAGIEILGAEAVTIDGRDPAVLAAAARLVLAEWSRMHPSGYLAMYPAMDALRAAIAATPHEATDTEADPLGAFADDIERRMPGLRDPDPLSDWGRGVAWAVDRARNMARPTTAEEDR